jgi:AP-3 complex subunit delta-1
MPLRFEKSLYDLIRGLRNHKGNEKEYIQNCLKECRSEIRGQDMGRSTAAPADDPPS